MNIPADNFGACTIKKYVIFFRVNSITEFSAAKIRTLRPRIEKATAWVYAAHRRYYFTGKGGGIF